MLGPTPPRATNSGVIIGDRFVMVSDATATQAWRATHRHGSARQRPAHQSALLTHLPRSACWAPIYAAEGATEIIASQGTLELIRERGAQDMKSEMERFPRLFRNAETCPA